MDQDRKNPNPAADKSKAEGDRWSSEADTVERVDRERKTPADEAGGITNRPLQEEERNQDRLPDRGDARDGAHAGHGDGRSQKQEDR